MQFLGKNIKLNEVNVDPSLGLAHKSGGINSLNPRLDIQINKDQKDINNKR